MSLCTASVGEDTARGAAADCGVDLGFTGMDCGGHSVTEERGRADDASRVLVDPAGEEAVDAYNEARAADLRVAVQSA